MLRVWARAHWGRGIGRAGAPLAPCSGAPLGAAAQSVRSFAFKARHRGGIYVPRKVSQETLRKATRNHPDPTLLLPPYVTARELRTLFKLDYPSVFRLLGVRHEQSRYSWKDFEGREFATTSKRKVLVPFDLAAIPAHGLGLRPRMVDVEPDWDPASRGNAPLVPVVAVLGHINHGKTTLLDALCGTANAEAEPGGITQGVRAMTGNVGHASVALDPATAGAPDPGAERVDLSRVTFLDTPGHAAFEVQRGRTMAAADAAVVVVSCERGAEVQTEEVLMHASKWKVPVVFALNKIDLPGSHLELSRAELRRQCQLLHEGGHVDVDWTREAEGAVPISALKRTNLGGLLQRLRATLAELPALPLRPTLPLTATPGEAKACGHILRRTDYLVGVEASPSAVALVVELERGAESGEQILTLILRSGRLIVGQFFVVGTAFGRITHLARCSNTLIKSSAVSSIIAWLGTV